ncbi:MAG TPA: hypothetical protein PK263_00240 [bacterium]|nr:hypothetical protein [bacterium]
MTIDELLEKSKEIWGDEGHDLSDVIVRLGKVFGDICRWERNADKDCVTHTDLELQKELGNVIFSTIKFCYELGYDPNECIEIAIESQRKGAAELKQRS